MRVRRRQSANISTLLSQASTQKDIEAKLDSRTRQGVRGKRTVGRGGQAQANRPLPRITPY